MMITFCVIIITPSLFYFYMFYYFGSKLCEMMKVLLMMLCIKLKS